MISPVNYVDGYLGAEKKLSVVPKVRFPFKNNPVNQDTYTREYLRRITIPAKGYVSQCGLRYSWTNVLSRSEEFDDSAWTKANATVTADQATAPDGASTLDKVLESTATGEHSVSQAGTVAATAQEASVFAVAGLTRRLLRLAFVDSAATTFSAYFDFLSGIALSPSAGVTAKVVPMGNGQFRCVIQFTPAAGAGTFKVNLASAVGTISYAGNAAAGGYLWGAQLTAGTETPYISTTSTTRTIVAPKRDDDDPFAFLIDEDDPQIGNSGFGEVTQTYSRIPLQQVRAGSRYVTKPELPGEFPQVNGNSLIIQPEENVPRWIFFTQIPVTSDSGSPNGSSPTGGTYTVTVGTSTTAPIAFGANAATLQAAINALTSVSTYGSVTVNGNYTGGFFITFNAFTAATLDTSGMPIFGSGAPQYVIGGVNVTGKRTMYFGMSAPNGYGFDSTGVFTITIFGQTTAPIAVTGTVTDVKNALEALSNIGVGNASVPNNIPGPSSIQYTGGNIRNNGGTKIEFTVTVAATLQNLSANAASLTPTGSTATATISDATNAVYSLKFAGVAATTRTLVAAGNGIATTDDIVLTQGTNYRTLPAGSFSLTPDSVILSSASGTAMTDPTVITAVGKATGNVYTAESKRTRTKLVVDYYLLGVSPGVDDLDDIPVPTYQGDDASLLAAIFNGSTAINLEVADLEDYKGGPIVAQARTTINASLL